MTYLHHHGYDKKVPWYRGEVSVNETMQQNDHWQSDFQWSTSSMGDGFDAHSFRMSASVWRWQMRAGWDQLHMTYCVDFANPLMSCSSQEWSYLRGGLSTIDRDYGIFNKIHHDIGTHVVHHLFPQIPHYNLEEAVSRKFLSFTGVLPITTE